MDDTIIVARVDSNSVPEEIRALVRPIEQIARLAAEKVVANYKEPERYLLTTDTNTFEYVLKGRFEKLPKVSKEAAVLKIMPLVAKPVSDRQRTYRGLSGVNLQSVDPISMQVQKTQTYTKVGLFDSFFDRPGRVITTALPLPFSRCNEVHVSHDDRAMEVIGTGSGEGDEWQVRRIRDGKIMDSGLDNKANFKFIFEYDTDYQLQFKKGDSSWSVEKCIFRIPSQELNNLDIFIHQLTCVDETNGAFGSEAGNDEIYLGGTSIDAMGNTNQLKTFRVGTFPEDGYVNPVANIFTTFDLRSGTDWPKSYFVTLALAEKDMGKDFPEFVNQLFKIVKKEVEAQLAKLIGTTLGVSSGPVGAIIGLAVGYAVGKVYEILRGMWNDDIFIPQTVSIKIPTIPKPFDAGRVGSNLRVNFKGHGGEYSLLYSWHLRP